MELFGIASSWTERSNMTGKSASGMMWRRLAGLKGRECQMVWFIGCRLRMCGRCGMGWWSGCSF